VVRVRILIAFCAAITVLAALAAASSAVVPKLHATMSGKSEVPKGDPDGTGKAVLIVSVTKVCYIITPKKAGSKFAAGHIHKGKPGVAGPIYLSLFTTPKTLTKGKLQGCVETGKGSSLLAKPGNYYVNIHNAKYPAGAIRGQLAPGVGH
jgi:CHRD domain